MKKSLSLFSLIFLWIGVAHAQQDPQFTQYMFNKLYFNPAVAGMDSEFGELTLLHRSQWAGYNSTFNDGSAPTTQSLSFSMPMPRKETFEGNPIGLGLNFVNDQLGLVSSQEAQLSLSYHLRLKRGQLSLGVRGGVYSQAIDTELLRPVEPGDPLIPVNSGSINDLVPDLSVGVYYHTVKYFFGLSVNRILGSEFTFENAGQAVTADNLTKMVPHGNFMAGYNWDASPMLTISPMALVKWASPNNFSIETSAIGTYDETFYLGLSYRQGDAASALAGVYLMRQKQLRLGYAFDLVVQGQNAKSNTSHEIRMTYRVPPIIKKGPSVIHTPKYMYF